MHIATATATGSAHINPGQPGKINNQDALVVKKLANGHIVVLSDGCGSQPISGIGADIGANIIARVIDQHLSKISSLKQINWGSITKDVQDNLRLGVNLFTSNNSADLESVVVERFLFTVMIVITTDNLAMIVSFGDGIVIIDDKVISIESPILNSPPYLGYMLLKDSAYHTKKLSSYLAFSVVKTIDLSKLKKGLIVGTDGLKDLMHEDLHHPSLVQPKTLQRWLNALTSEKIHNGSFITGKCSDDVSMVIIRTDKAQDRLLKSRREVAELKREIARLQSELTTAVESLKKAEASREETEKNLADLRQIQIRTAMPYSDPIHSATKQISKRFWFSR